MDKIGVKTFFFAIGDYSRFTIMVSLLKTDLNVNEIVAATGIEQSNVSHHMSCLLNCGFVSVRKEGKERFYGVNADMRLIIRSIMKHVESYKDRIIACDVANKEYISKVIK